MDPSGFCAQSANHICDLPVEILLEIFSYFDVRSLSCQIARVCKLWYVIAHDPCLWKSFEFYGGKVTGEEIEMLLRKYNKWTRLKLVERDDVISILSQCAVKSTNIESLEIRHCHFDYNKIAALSKFFTFWPHLTSLTIIELTYCRRMDFNSFVAMMGVLENLRGIRFSFFFDFYLDDVYTIVKAVGNLKEVSLRGEWLTQRSGDLIKEANSRFVQACCILGSNIRALEFDAWELNDEGASGLAMLPSLKSLLLHNAYNITENGLNHFRSLGSLQTLLLSEGYFLSDSSWEKLFCTGNFLYLSVLAINRFRSEDRQVIRRIAMFCPRLREIYRNDVTARSEALVTEEVIQVSEYRSIVSRSCSTFILK